MEEGNYWLHSFLCCELTEISIQKNILALQARAPQNDCPFSCPPGFPFHDDDEVAKSAARASYLPEKYQKIPLFLNIGHFITR